MEKLRVFVVFLLFAVCITGCAVPVKEDRGGKPDLSSLSTEYLQAARQQEAAGDLVAALRSFKLALTVDANNQEAVKGCTRLETEIRSSAERHYQAGLSLQEKGKYALARKEFLTALRLYPDYEEARKMVTARTRTPIKGHILHKVKPGETLSALAARYYGDYRKFPVIAQYNNLGDAAVLRVGQELKIPGSLTMSSVDSKEVAEEEDVAKTPADSQDMEDDVAQAEHMGLSEDIELSWEADEMEQIAIYRDHGIELYNDRAYQEAIIEFNKVLASNPNDRVALDYLYKCHFGQSMDLYEKKEYLAARDGFRASLKYRANCRQCHTYMNNCENSYKKLHYTKGMQFYHNEQLEEAIREWELVKKEDPDYKKVNYLINKARTIQKKMNELKAKETGR